MIGPAKIYFFIFGALTIVGGIVGYMRAGSVISVVAGAISGILLIVAAWILPEHFAVGLVMALAVSLVLTVQFLPKFVRTGKMMPAGLMTILSMLGVVIALVAWLRK